MRGIGLHAWHWITGHTHHTHSIRAVQIALPFITMPPDVSNLWDQFTPWERQRIQTEGTCCGYADLRDRPQPSDTCKRALYSCSFVISEQNISNTMWLAVPMWTMCGVQFLLIVTALCLLRRQRRRRQAMPSLQFTDEIGLVQAVI